MCLKERAAICLLILVSVATILRDALVLFRYPVAVGLDGYYYVQQINNILSQGKLYYPTTAALILYLLAIPSSIFGIITGLKIGVLFLQLLLCLGVYALVAEAFRSRGLGILAYGIAASSALHFYLVGEFIRETGAIAFLVWACWSFLKAENREQGRKAWLFLSASLLAVALFSHISALAYACLLVFIWLCLRLLISDGASSPSKWVGSILLAMLWGLPFFLSHQAFLVLPIQINSELLPWPQWPIGGTGWPEKLVALMMLATYFGVTLARKEHPRRAPSSHVGSVAAIACAVLTLNPFLNYGTGIVGIAGRLGNVVHLSIAILIPAVIYLWRPRLSFTTGVLGMVIISLLLLGAVGPLPRGLRPEYLWDRQQLHAQLPRLRERLDLHSLIIAPHGDQFLFTATLGVPSQWEWPSGAQNYRIFWFLRKVPGASMTPGMAIVTGDERMANVLVEDEELRKALKSMKSDQLESLLADNIHLYAALEGISHAPLLLTRPKLPLRLDRGNTP